MIYICIPAHNEEQTVGVVLWKIRQEMAEFPRDYQLLVVDDASTDKTADVLAPYARVLPLTVVRTPTRQGEGAALEMMLREAVRRSEYPKRDIIITLQADFTQDPDEVVGLIKRMEAGADIVVGQSPPDAKTPRAVRWARALALRVLGKRRIPEGVTDPFTGYRAYRVFAVRKALEEHERRLMHWGGWAGAAELLLATAPHARRIETADVVTRRERLQRPSRLQPWAALKQVWSLAREARPLAVATPAQLDEAMRTIAAVRTSELHASPAERAQRSAARRGSSEERGRGRGEPRRERARPERPERPRREPSERRPRPEGEARRVRPEKPAAQPAEARAERQSRRSRKGQQATSTPTVPEPLTAEPVPVPVASTEGVEAVQPAPAEQGEKRKRRRPRRRKRPGSAAAATGAEGTDDVLAGILDDSPAADADEGAEGGDDEGMTSPEGSDAEGAPKSRRRRRGRRGGRRRNRDAGAAQNGEEGSQPAEPTAEQIAIFELLQGDPSDESS